MESISDLIRAVSSLPKGDVYIKNIKGRTYYYHQFFEHGKRYSKLLHADQVEPLKEQIAKRKELESRIKALSRWKTTTLAKSAREFSGCVMLRDRPVAKFEKGDLVSLDEEHCPLIIKRTHSLLPFLQYRVIDGSRTNARLLKKALAIQEKDDPIVSLYAYAATINDPYWFRPNHSKLKYADITFDSDAFAEISLKGDMTLLPAKPHPTPELTTSGSFEKGWKREDGHWWLYKTGTKQEIFSELLCVEIAKAMGIPTASYAYQDGYIKTLNFAETAIFEPMVAIAGDDDGYENVFNALEELNPNLLPAYMRLAFFDAVTNNVDRHNENCGVMRDEQSGEILSLAPNFDCNLALISRTPVLASPEKDGLIKMLLSFVRKNEKAKNGLFATALPHISQEDIERCILALPAPARLDVPGLAKKVVDRYDYILKELS